MSALGGIALDDTAAVVSRGGTAAADWSKAQAATSTVNSINAGWLALGNLTGLAPADPQYPALRFADVGTADWQRLELARKKLLPWEAVGMGLTLSLPTLTEYRERVAVLTAALAAVEEASAPVDRERESIKEWAARTAPALSAANSPTAA